MKSNIPVYLVTGFLGSGKTTFLRRAIDAYAGPVRVGVVQNEFAPSNFDGKELKRQSGKDFSLLEVNNGSVFCVCLLSGFIRSLKQFAVEHDPELIIIEASGLSDPVAVGEIFNSPELQSMFFLAGIVCIADASNFLKMEKIQSRMTRQAAAADFIVINKSDLNADYAPVEKRIREINPQCRLFISTFSDIPLEQVFFHGKSNISPRKEVVESLGRPDIRSAVLKTVRPLKAVLAHAFINEIAQRSLRMKGYLALDNGKCLAVQGIVGAVTTEEVEPAIRQTELVTMSYELSPEDVSRRYRENCT